MKYSFFFTVAIIGLIFGGCNPKLSDPQKIIDRAIQSAGGEKFANLHVEYDFRDKHYIAKTNGGQFSYERVFKDSANTIHDFVTNDGFKREVNGEAISVPDSMAVKYTSSINSVHYFAFLPYKLNDAAVIKKYLGESTINGQVYDHVQITFRPEGGGEDHEDVFLYWINQKTFAIDYLAYSFAESDETSFRFRVAYNPRTVGGIRFQDYVNYKPKNNSLTVDQAEDLFKKGELVELSRIDTENVIVH